LDTPSYALHYAQDAHIDSYEEPVTNCINTRVTGSNLTWSPDVYGSFSALFCEVYHKINWSLSKNLWFLYEEDVNNFYY